MKAIDFLDKDVRNWYKTFCFLPASCEGDKLHDPSRSELKRWLEKGSVQINGVRPRPNDEIKYPIKQFILHPGGNRCTIIDE